MDVARNGKFVFSDQGEENIAEMLDVEGHEGSETKTGLRQSIVDGLHREREETGDEKQGPQEEPKETHEKEVHAVSNESGAHFPNKLSGHFLAEGEIADGNGGVFFVGFLKSLICCLIHQFGI